MLLSQTFAEAQLLLDTTTTGEAQYGETKLVACVARNSGSGWELIDDAFHKPINMDSASNTTTNIVLDYSSMGASEVGSLTVVPDETYSSLGFVFGASVANGDANIRASKLCGNRAAGLFRFNTSDGGATGTVDFPTSNQNVGISSITYAMTFVSQLGRTVGLFTVNHDTFTTKQESVQPVIGPRRDCPAVVSINAVTNSTTTFWFRDYDGTDTVMADGDTCFFSRGLDYIHEIVDPNTMTNALGNIWIYGGMVK